MADLNIQRKKTTPSPWLLVLLTTVVLAIGAYFFLRTDPVDEPSPTAEAGGAEASADTVSSTASARQVDSLARRAEGTAVTNSEADAADVSASLAAQAATSPAAPNYARHGLQKLTGVLVALTDRDDLRDPTTTEQRDNLTSATNRLDETTASLRPGFVAAAGLIRAMQQKAYPELEGPANDLVRLAGQLSGRSATAAEQQQNQQFLTQAAAAVRVLSEPVR